HGPGIGERQSAAAKAQRQHRQAGDHGRGGQDSAGNSKSIMEVKDIRTIYFIGIGGIGMNALARYFKFHGATVSGYDRTTTTLTHQLESEGIAIHYEEDVDAIPKHPDLV